MWPRDVLSIPDICFFSCPWQLNKWQFIFGESLDSYKNQCVTFTQLLLWWLCFINETLESWVKDIEYCPLEWENNSKLRYYNIITFKQTSCKWICLQETYCWQFAQVVNTSQPVNSLNFFSHQRAYSCNLQLTNKTLQKIAKVHLTLFHKAFWDSVELCLHLVPASLRDKKLRKVETVFSFSLLLSLIYKQLFP